jgi:putative ABC transport system permease protein
MTSLPFAWRSLVRQPARSALGVLGVAAVGALLLDMLLLSNGMIVSMRDLLDRTGFDVRVTTTADLPRTAPRLEDARSAVARVAALREVRGALAIRFADATIDTAVDDPLTATIQAVHGTSRPWSVTAGTDITAEDVVVNQALASALGVAPGEYIAASAACGPGVQVLPNVRLRISGIAAFPFELTGEHSIGTTLDLLDRVCGADRADTADMLMVSSTGDAQDTAEAIQRLRPDLRAATNEEMLGRVQRGGFTYFQQISTVLTTVTVAFAWLLIAVLLTVSVNQRLGEIAALRALGFTRRRVVSDILWESTLIVGAGGLLSLPVGLLLASGLDRILKQMPNIPVDLHFFVFEPSALAVHAALLSATALLAALYPMRIVARLPIASTLRNEVL